MIFTHSHLKDNLLPDFDNLKKFIKTARDENRKTRDTRPLMNVLQRIPEADQYFLGLMQTRKIALLGFDYQIKFPDEFTPDSNEEKRLDEVRLRFQKSKMYQTFNSLMNGILFGQSAVRLTWENSQVYKSMVVKKKHLELTELDFSDEDSTSLDYVETLSDGKAKRSPLDPETHLFVRFNPLEGIVNDFPGSYVRSNMIYAIIKYLDFFNWSSANEKYADPLRYAQYKKNTNPEEVSKIMAGLAQLGSDSYAAFSDDVQVKFLEALRTGITDMHKELVSAIKTEMAISILGQTLTTDLQNKGSFAAAKVHNFVRQDILWGDIIEIQNIISSQYLVKDYLMNYGEPKNAYPIFEFKTDEIQDSESNARVVSELRGTFTKEELPLKKSEVYEKINFSEPEEGETEIV